MVSDQPTLLLDTFIELADTLAGDYDVADLLQMLVDRAAELLEADTVGVLLEQTPGRPSVAAATSQEMLEMERLELELGQGPCLQAFRDGEQVIADDLEEARGRWPDVTPRILELGLRSAYAFPLRLRGDRIGALNVYRRRAGGYSEAEIRLGQALADVAAVGIIQERAVTDAERRSEQLQHALNSRIVIEQAKGLLAERRGLSADEAFLRLRSHARHHNLKLRDVSRRLIDGDIAL